MKILMVTPDLEPGGAQLAMSRLAAGLAGSHEVFVYALVKPSGPGQVMQNLRSAGIRLFGGPFRGIAEKISRRLGLLEKVHGQRLRRLLRYRGIHVVNGHQVVAERTACLAFRNQCVPLIGTDHGCYRALLTPASGLGRRDDYASVFWRSDGLICPSSSNVQIASQHSWKPGFRTWKVFNGYDLPGESKPLRRRGGGGPFVFGMVARGIPEKGWAEAVEAFQLVRATAPCDVALRLIGAGPEVVHSFRGGLGNSLQGIELTEHVDDIRPFLREIDVGLLPTSFELESLPNSVIEYLAHGLPVVATSMGGIPEMLESGNGLAGILVPLDPATRRADVGRLAEAMLRLTADDNEWQSLSRKALNAARKFDLASAEEQYSEIFRQVVSDAKNHPAAASRERSPA